MDGTWLTFAQR